MGPKKGRKEGRAGVSVQKGVGRSGCEVLRKEEERREPQLGAVTPARRLSYAVQPQVEGWEGGECC